MEEATIAITKTEHHYRVEEVIDNATYRALVIISDGEIIRINEGVISKENKSLGNFWYEQNGNLSTNFVSSADMWSIFTNLTTFIENIKAYNFN